MLEVKGVEIDACVWWCVYHKGQLLAQFLLKVDANIYCQMLVEHGCVRHAKLASGLKI